jgi:hypothetical protein
MVSLMKVVGAMLAAQVFVGSLSHLEERRRALGVAKKEPFSYTYIQRRKQEREELQLVLK